MPFRGIVSCHFLNAFSRFRSCNPMATFRRISIRGRKVTVAGIHDAKTSLSRYLAELTPGEPLVLCNRNQPVAER
jgi:hypothetical protein